MAIPVEQEARIWQTIGIVAWAAGAGMLAVLMKENGLIRVTDTAVLSTGIAASFMMLAGIAGTVFGRVMNALRDGYNPSEARLWHTLASVCCSCGAFSVLYIAVGHWNKPLSLTSLTVGLAGSFLVMAGVICLLGNRVMGHTSGQRGSAKAAGA
jgi:p-aminobenzoyl-glutamate transporter AbgT